MKTENEIQEMSSKIKALAGERALTDSLLTESVGIIDALDWVLERGAVGFLPSFILNCEDMPKKETEKE